MPHWKKLQGRRSNLLGIFLISGDSWIWHRLVIDISCCSCASSAWLITYPIFYHSGESLLKCYLPGMSATHRHTIAASPDFLRLKLWADGINYPPFSAMLHWKKLQRQDKSYVKSLRKGTPAFLRNATLKKATAAGQKLCSLLFWRKLPPFSAMLHWKKLQGRRSNWLGIFLISGDSWKKLQRQDKSYVNSVLKEIRKPLPHRILRRRTGIRSRGAISRVVLTILVYS